METYDNVLFKRFKYFFNFPTFCYLKYRMQFFKNTFIPSGILSHMFHCPRSEFAVNKCYRCALLHANSHPTFFYILKHFIE